MSEPMGDMTEDQLAMDDRVEASFRERIEGLVRSKRAYLGAAPDETVSLAPEEVLSLLRKPRFVMTSFVPADGSGHESVLLPVPSKGFDTEQQLSALLQAARRVVTERGPDHAQCTYEPGTGFDCDIAQLRDVVTLIDSELDHLLADQ